MLRSDYIDQNCSVARALEVVGERWTLLIVRELLLAPRRFSELQRRLDAPKNVLTVRLEKLVSAGVVEKTEIDRVRDWNAYSLTKKGLDLYPVVGALMNWGDAYAAPEGPPVVVRHECGHTAGHRLVCEGCGEPLDPLHLHAHPGPGWTGP